MYEWEVAHLSSVLCFSPKDEKRQVNPALCVSRVRLISSFLTIARLIDKAITKLCHNCDCTSCKQGLYRFTLIGLTQNYTA